MANTTIPSELIAADAITGAKIADNAVDSEHYTDGSIDTAHIADSQVTVGKMAANSVDSDQYVDGSIDTAHIADDQVTLAKMAGLARGKIIVGDSSGNPAALAIGTSGYVLKSDGTDIAWAADADTAALTTEQVQDIAGAMFSSNTETGITATYQDADGTIDLVVGTLNQNTTGSAATLTTARTIGGTSFDGSANIAVGLAATATTLATARTIGGVSFDGSANIDLPGVNSAGNQNVDAALVDGENFKINGGQGDDGQVLTSTGSGVAWEDAAGGGPTFKTFGTGSIMVGDNATGTIDAANNNTGLGVDIFTALTTGDSNAALGTFSLELLTTGTGNSAVGYKSLEAVTTGGYNTALGWVAGYKITTGTNNVCIGSTAGDAITEGDYNVAVGDNALTTNTTADNNTAVGANALLYNTTGGANTAVGLSALSSNTTASSNTAVGNQALAANTTAANLVAIGRGALESNTTGPYNTAVGYNCLDANTTGDYNTAVGHLALTAETTGQANDCFGYKAGATITTAASNVCIGSFSMDSGAAQTGGGNTAIGHASSRSLTSGYNNSACGLQTLYAISTGVNNTAIGANAGADITSGSNNQCFGVEAGKSNGPGGSITTASGQIVVGNGDATNAHIQIDWTVASDKRDKTDVTPLDMGLSFINKLEPVTYKWDKRGKYEEGETPDGTHKESWTDVGFLAQDVEKIEAEFGHKIEDETNLTTHMSEDESKYGLTYAKFIPMLVKSVQELSTQVDELKSELLALKGE
jgi:hypothetical protein